MEDKGLDSNPHFDLYDDELESNQTYPQIAEELKPMPDVDDQCIKAEVQLPREEEMARGKVVVCSPNTNGNIIARANANPIKDNWLYQVQFEGGKATELTIKVTT